MKRMNHFGTRWSKILALQTMVIVILSLAVHSLSPEDFKRLYASKGPQIERRPVSKDKTIFGYIAPTEKPADRFHHNFDVVKDTYLQQYLDKPKTPSEIATVTINTKPVRYPFYGYTASVQKYENRPPSYEYYRPTDNYRPRPTEHYRPSNIYRPKEGHRPYGTPVHQSKPFHRPTESPKQEFQHGGRTTETHLQHVQNLVHLRNVHSLAQSIDERRKIPYGYTRDGKKYWDSTSPATEADNTSESTWTAHAIMTDPEGQESIIIEEAVSYKEPISAGSRYSTIEIDTETQDPMQERTYLWDTHTNENFITKRPLNTMLKKHHTKKEIKISKETGLDVVQPGHRTLLRPLPHPITFRTKVGASVGVQPVGASETLTSPEDGGFSINHLLSQGFVIAPHSTPVQTFSPLASPPGNSDFKSNFVPSSTTAEIEHQGVLPVPGNVHQQQWVGSTTPTFGSSFASTSSYSSPVSGSSSYATPSSGPYSSGGSSGGYLGYPSTGGYPATGGTGSTYGTDRMAQSKL